VADPDLQVLDFIERRLAAEEGRGMDVFAHLEA
jgi:hypothetical protein